jgi:3-methyladenine DNA glycosylase/8-oxoguanine DNA glycosylase
VFASNRSTRRSSRSRASCSERSSTWTASPPSRSSPTAPSRRSSPSCAACARRWRTAESVVGFARCDLDLHGLALLPDEEVKASLTALTGIGEWTADWFLARHLGRPHAWPAGDLGLRKAVSKFYGDGRALSTEEVRAMGKRFAPFQNLSAHYLLSGLLVGATP